MAFLSLFVAEMRNGCYLKQNITCTIFYMNDPLRDSRDIRT